MGSRREQALIAILLVVVLGLAVLMTPDQDGGLLDLRASTMRSAPPGAMALYLTLESLEVPVERRLTDWVDGAPLRGTLGLLAPAQPLTPFEVDALVAWVERGGALILGGGWFDDAGLFEELGLERTRLEGDAQPALPGESHPWSRDSVVIEGFRWRFGDDSPALDRDDTAVVLRTAVERHPLVVTFPRGAGRVVAWSDVGPLVNEALRESGAALVFARAAADLTAQQAPLVFDEYHHGYREDAGPVRAMGAFLLSTGPGWMVLQLGAVALGLLWMHGRRFGTPHEPPPARRRSPLEHVDALAGAYRQGAARATARRLIVAGLARRLGRSAPPAGSEEEWLRLLASRMPGDARQAEALAAEWRRGSDANLVALARHADALAKE